MIERVRNELFITVSVPRQEIWAFLKQFGEDFFSRTGMDDLGRQFNSPHAAEFYRVDSRTPEKMLVAVKLPHEMERAFDVFCQNFSPLPQHPPKPRT